MSTLNIGGMTPIDRMLRRYRTTDTKCPRCGYVDEEGNWTSRTDGRQIVYHHVCPSCSAERDHTFQLHR